MAAYHQVYDTCRLTANNRYQLWNPTLSNRVQATFTFLVGLEKRLVLVGLGLKVLKAVSRVSAKSC